MSELVGQRLGAFEVLALLGEGGMGKVYRATDTKLKRQVAIKVLPPSVVDNPERLARFHREAELLASLNHPNVAQIYGFEEAPGAHAIVMELVEGPTLADRIAAGPMPLAEALPIAKQMVEALDAAHERGIIHRDLKPANVKVREDGTVKVLDFGLAKLVDPTTSNANLTMSPTITSPAMTQAGVILGTAAYMSPEQARGKAVDKRADIWAFGCVLFEMLAGERPFQGTDLTETLAAIVKDQPDISKTPREVRRLLRKCLEKDPRKRLRDLGDVWDLLDDSPMTPVATGAVVTAGWRSWLAWTVAGVLAVALAASTWRRPPVASSPQPSTHLQLATPNSEVPGFFALSPDGRSLLLARQTLAIRSLDSGETRVLTGTDFARAPFWSADSKAVGFFSPNDRTLKTVAAAGGVPQTLCADVESGGSGTWSKSGVILFSTTQLFRVDASGGSCTELLKAEGLTRRMPLFLPDGEHFLYVQGSPDPGNAGLYVASLGDPSVRRLLSDSTTALFMPDAPGMTRGRLLFVREQTLMAQPFDTGTLELSGEPRPVAANVSYTLNGPQIAASVSDDGTLVYATNTRAERQLAWRDRSGADLGKVAAIGIQAAAPTLSPDGNRAVFTRSEFGRPFLWVVDFERKLETRVVAPGTPSSAIWLPDSQRVAFSANLSPEQPRALYVKRLNGGADDVMLKGTVPIFPSSWSRDGRWLIYTVLDQKTGADIWLMPDPGESSTTRAPVPLLRGAALESQGQLSPDGKWLAYTSTESGNAQVYLRAFNGSAPLSDTKWQVSRTQTAQEPRWRADGKELFYIDASPRRLTISAVAIGGGSTPVGTPTRLFEFASGSTVPNSNVFSYSPNPDGQRFLVDTYVSDAPPSLEIILNWRDRK